ncbi:MULTISPECIES: DUF3429 domain-containing protein [unclassified Methylophilus]|uniref:DUF3429 domain-containing protein n=1 Tax=unclassified Methylophilus TaxID=2630143 RepID=UPI0023B2AFE9|nr:DUF3429 domain-containing protein [Methylophilus sp. YYY-1]BEV09238.1 DUF3429 domain-containing protein [Methylophilus sp. DW102]
MRPIHIQLAKTLTFMGALPFAGAVVAQMQGMAHYHTGYLALTYGAVIISFLCGIHWGLFLNHAQDTRLNLLVTSNLLALLAWATLFFVVPVTQYLVQIAAFIVLWLIDRKLVAEGLIERWFYQLRTQITLLVTLCLCAMLVLQF